MNLKTTIRAYHFDTTKPAEREAYAELSARLQAQGLDCMCSWGGNSHYMPDLDGAELELETAHIFNNQWNTAPIPGDAAKTGRRVFDWAEDHPINFRPSIKRGHYLEVTEEMRAIRHDTAKCRYCGAHEPAGKFTFCPHCIDSEYLKEKDLHLTRMMRVDDEGNAPKLSEAERAELLPKFREAQIHGSTERGKARMAKARQDAIDQCARRLESATTERDGLLWLMDRGIRTDNVIFYSHTGRFGFGWRTGLDAAEYSAFCDLLCEFPFDYDMKREGEK